jgi:glutamate transport system substrate-binding protein
MRERPRRLVLLALAVGLLLLAAACGGGDQAGAPAGEAGGGEAPTFDPGSKMAEIQQRGTLHVGVKYDQPLFGVQNPTSGEVEGFDVEIAKIIAEGIFGEGNTEGRIEFVESVSANREPFLQNGQVDMVVATYTINDQRKEVVDFAGPYYIAGQDIMVRADNEDIQGVEDLNGKRVCTVQGSTSLQNLQQQASQAQVITFDTYSKCAEALSDGRVEAVTTDNVILLGLIERAGEEFKLVENPFTQEPYGIGVPKGADDFRTFINDQLEEAYENGEWAQAYESTVGTVAEAVPEPPPVDRY